MLNPLTASSRIRDEYRQYLLSTFPLRRADLRDELEHALKHEFALTKGPYLQASPPFVTGASVRELVEDGVLSQLWLDFPEAAFPLDRPLYKHQELAIRKAVADRRNLIVTTGTGSGKTECFLLPVIDGLLREVESGHIVRPGVRSLLLYPMNALANDQLKRLRTLLAHVEKITFGRYVGDTRHGASEAEADFAQRYPSEPRLANELIAREVMQATPPHILLTNYAMLEYLLLRPEDSSFFDGPTGRHWRSIALDEIHVYDGTQGAEVAMLLRRVRDRVNSSEVGLLQCFGTSATLGGGRNDYPELVRFAQDLFDEPFLWDEDNPATQDVVGAERKPLVRGQGSWTIDAKRWRAVQSAYRSGADATVLQRHAGEDSPPADKDESPESWLARTLSEDTQVIALQRKLEEGSAALKEVAQDVIGPGADAEPALVDLVDLGVVARHREDDAAVIPARYHFFLRALEGAFVCLHPLHPDGSSRLRLSRHEACPDCARVGRKAVTFELGSCRRCGAEYAIGSLTRESDDFLRLQQSGRGDGTGARVLLGDALPEGDDDEDETSVSVLDADKAVPGLLCAGCGILVEGDGPLECRCSEPPKPLKVAIAKVEAGQEVRRCLACAKRSPGEIVSRFLTGSDAPVAVIATDLYQEIPPSQDQGTAATIGRGRKLLTFSDSRQDAAFFAPYLERTYNRAIQRRLIQLAVDELGAQEPSLDDLLLRIRKDAERELVIDPDGTTLTKNKFVSEWLVRELLAVDRRQTLEGTGVAEIRLRLPHGWEPPPALLEYGLDQQEAEDLVRLLIDTVRLQGAINAPEGVDLRDPAFAPRALEISIREHGSASGMLAWMSGKGKNGRLALIERVLQRKGAGDRDPKELLAKLWQMLTNPNLGWDKVLTSIQAGHHGAAYRLDPNRFVFVPADDDHLPGRCSQCRQLWWRTVAGVCPSFGCDGTVTGIEDRASLSANHYARLYQSLEPIGLSVQEHTAQWVSSEASAIQDQFVRGKINVLSCSTTFELGVDVGEVQAVLLRNVPPSPANYVQRAGRAGRRTDSAALVVCFAQRRSHDLHYFERPTRMVDGIIPPPHVPLTNVPIVRRHAHSVAFAAYQRETQAFRNTKEFFIDADAGDTHDRLFVDWLRTHPGDVGAALARVIPLALHDPLGIEDWSWVPALVEKTDDQPTFGWLHRAGLEVRDDSKVLTALEEEAAEDKNYKLAGHLARVRDTLGKRHLLGFLASRNILPKYGFPVDVVELNLGKSADPTAGKLELSRDLEMAIRDYAPGATVVAGKALWRSEGLALRRGQTWPTYHWAVCSACGAFRQGLESLPEKCDACGSESEIHGGKYVIPIHGFVGDKASSTPGESRPRGNGVLRTYFGSYGGETPVLEPVEELSADGRVVEQRFSHQGLITVLNRGITNGFLICEWCGHGEPAGRKKRKKEHPNPARPGVECTGPKSFVQLGHRYLTDVLELRLGEYLSREQALSTLNALTAAVADFGIRRDDVAGTLDWFAQGRPAFIIYDAVPGGAGHAQRLSRELPRLFRAAADIVEDCECGEETSCYSCLRSYKNQIDHEFLVRGEAKHVIGSVLSGAERSLLA